MKTIDSLQLSPAESLFIIIFENPNNGASAIARKYYRPAFRTKLMTLTFFDLLLRKVLKVDFRIESFGFIFKRTSKRTYIVRGEYFSNTNLKPHELPFKNCIERTNAGLELRDLAERLKGLFFELENPRSIEKLIRKALISGGYIESKEIKKKFRYSEKGLKAKEKIGKLLVEGETRLEYLITNEPTRAKAFFQVCGGNILLIEKYDLKQITEWGEFLFTKNIKTNMGDYFDFYLADKLDFDFDFENISDIDIDNSFNAVYEDHREDHRELTLGLTLMDVLLDFLCILLT